ncbi:UDP-N-acetylglucosamine 1-carboxyvinyltransferase [Prosthecochloris sp. ZM]|uniref:UDP-N-acetylglucosamine 1-carboxyvinyltransferase n=1 Tax=unclassified Prosthecochloris TaxID=2632826 RepID=UPI000DF7292E|nr:MULTISPECIES: UDP-N-acetylglucosamine 1-carboxyvinyltransferase [unclassified Prosthecochloris]NEX12123.1 UDP-N-acetylglucosamine 1-carboxyvinyltransferase [Prosthecochloris sp.]RDD30737.1 UDP-N-acetylglucosamine 1-carboxyvinyltransferase [Prosthecochloris sp. ZM]
MDKLVINGGHRLTGSVAASGSKNSALPLIAATLLCDNGTCRLERIPDLKDTRTFQELLAYLGADISYNGSRLSVSTQNLRAIQAPYELVKKMRASIYVLGPLLARFGRAEVSLPGGCAFGPRPIDLHLMAMEKLGASISIKNGYIEASIAKGRLTGGHIEFPVSSVGATGNALMAASLAEGTTTITNASIEPEITALCDFLMAMGADIKGAGTTALTIEGVPSLHPVAFTNIFDRIEAGTLLAAAAITKGTISITGIDHTHMGAVLKKFKQAGCRITIDDDSLTLQSPDRLEPTDIIASPYPFFPTDMQAQWIALMTQANGSSRIIDKVYHERFNHIPELNRLGAKIEINNNEAIVHGPQLLTGTTVMSTDLRASACLVLAGLVAQGTTEVLRVYHLDRGYEKIEEKLRHLGADIQRENYQEFST